MVVIVIVIIMNTTLDVFFFQIWNPSLVSWTVGKISTLTWRSGRSLHAISPISPCEKEQNKKCKVKATQRIEM